jgi:surface antigen
VVDFQNVPSRDGLDHLFGDAGFDGLIGTPSQPSQVPTRREAQAALPSRRDLRAKPKGRARKAAPKPPAFVQPSDSAYPATRVIVVRQAPKQQKKKRGSGFLTILAVVGLFGSVALPAYAMAPQADANTLAADVQAENDAALTVSNDVALATTARGSFQATSASDLKNQKRTSFIAANYAAYMASGAREKGDDYPWFSELSDNQGGGLSPLNYFYRECVDFVAWRLNRDAGSFSAPFLYDWSYLTPSGGNAYQWKYAWQKHGWTTSTTPVAGAVAWYSYNHVAYVKQVNADGTIVVEDYNQSGMHQYDIRTVPANDAQLYLYAPPR